MTPIRLMVGFIAGFLSVLILLNAVNAVLYAAGISQFPPWNMRPLPPFGVPQTLSAAFWGGLWGMVYALLEPKLTARLGWWGGGLVFGAVLPVLMLWFVVIPLKGGAVGGGFVAPRMLQTVFTHAVFGLGVAIVYRFGLPIAVRKLVSAPFSQRPQG